MNRRYQLALRRAEKHLSMQTPRMAKWIDEVGRCGLDPHWDRSPYESLVRAVAFQQLHGKAAMAILGRLLSRFPNEPFPTPEQVLSVSPEEMRACGFSQSKATTIYGLAEGARQHIIPSRAEAEELGDEVLIERLCQLKGVGRWTVEMLLIFTLGRLDVMPMDDFGVKVGLQHLFRLEAMPKKADFAELTSHWAPFRSVGAWYLWRVADGLKATAKKK